MSELPEEARNSSAVDIQTWVEDSLPRALAYARSLIDDRHAAEDVVQDCFCRLLGKREVYDLPSDGFKLLLRSITNACIDRGRKIAAISNTLDQPEDTSGGREVVDERVLQPPRSVMYHELQAAIGVGLQTLPVKQRAALEQKSLGCSLQEIAESLEVTENHAAVLIHRARQSLTKALGPLLNDDMDDNEQ